MSSGGLYRIAIYGLGNYPLGWAGNKPLPVKFCHHDNKITYEAIFGYIFFFVERKRSYIILLVYVLSECFKS